MKNKIATLLLIFTSTLTFSQIIQDWDLSPLNQKTYFEREGGFLEMYYNDSTEIHPNYRKHFFGEKYYKQGFNGCYEEVKDHLEIYDLFFDTTFVIEEWYSNNEFFYTLHQNDTIKFHNKAPLNFNWNISVNHMDFDQINFQCTLIELENIHGIMDSVRTYQTSTFKNGNPVNSIIHEKEIRLSRRFGLIQFTPFYRWIKSIPNAGINGQEFNLFGQENLIDTIGKVPSFDLLFEAFSVGDVYKWKHKSPILIFSPDYANWWRKDSLTFVSFYSDSLLEYQLNRNLYNSIT